MADERQARLEARARIDIKKLYEKGQITLKDHASAIGYLRGVWFDHLSDIEIEDFICREIRKLELPTIQPVEQLLDQESWFLVQTHQSVSRVNVTIIRNVSNTNVETTPTSSVNLTGSSLILKLSKYLRDAQSDYHITRISKLSRVRSTNEISIQKLFTATEFHRQVDSGGFWFAGSIPGEAERTGKPLFD